jgi:hypothetical protein
MSEKNRNKFFQKTLEKLQRKLDMEAEKQGYIMYGSVCIALWRYWGWRTQRLSKLIDVSEALWNECISYGNDKGMIQMLDEETGIELRLSEDGRSWREFDFLNGNLKIYGKQMSYPQIITMQQGQLRWLGTLVQAGIFLALYRKERFGYERIKRLIGQMFDIQDEYDNDAEKIRAACEQITNIRLQKTVMIRKEEKSKEEHYFELTAQEAVEQVRA